MTGSLQRVRDSNGELVWRVQWRENGKGRTRTLGKIREMGRAEAAALLNAIVKPLQEARGPRSASVSFEDFVRSEYLTARSATWKRSTESTTTDLLERHVIQPFKGRILSTITRRELQELLNTQAMTYSDSVVKRVRFQLRAIFEMASGDGRITTNPTHGLKNPRGARKTKAPAVGDHNQIVSALVYLPIREKLFTSLCVLRGMRPGEVAALQVGDIDGDNLRVERRVYRGVIDSVKNDRPRTVPLGSLQTLVDSYLSCLLDQSSAAWLFPSETGKTPINYPALFRKRIEPMLKAAGVSGLNFQAMRKTFAVAFRRVEPDAKMRAEIMGHSVDVHENTYTEIADDLKRVSIGKLGDNLQ